MAFLQIGHGFPTPNFFAHCSQTDRWPQGRKAWVAAAAMQMTHCCGLRHFISPMQSSYETMSRSRVASSAFAASFLALKSSMAALAVMRLPSRSLTASSWFFSTAHRLRKKVRVSGLIFSISAASPSRRRTDSFDSIWVEIPFFFPVPLQDASPRKQGLFRSPAIRRSPYLSSC